MKTNPLFNLICCLFLLIVLLNTAAFAQSPLALPYQALARDNAGNPVMNRTVSVRLSVREATATGVILYRETQSVTTNIYGIFNLNIGQGTVVSGTFSSIDWGSAAKFVQVEIDLNGGSTFITMGTQQLMSVPYSLYSANGWNLKGNAGTSPITSFIGTTDANDLTLRTNNTEKVRVTSAGNVGIGTAVPLNKLHVVGNICMVDGNQAAGKVLTSDVNGTASWKSVGNGTVTSVGVTMPSIFNVTGSPVTNSGTFVTTLANQSANTILAGPSSGVAAVPTFRSLVATDIPSLTPLQTNAWGTKGNSGVDTSFYIGIKDTVIPLKFKVKNELVGLIDSSLFNVAWGTGALRSNSTGLQNTANGFQSLFSNTIGVNNTANGFQSLFLNTIGNNNTAIGSSSLKKNTSGSNNTANGSNSLYYNTTGDNNTASGMQSLFSNTTGYNNTASGTYSLLNNTTGFNNTASGAFSLFNNTTGYNNTASSAYSLFSNTIGYTNTASGVYSLYSNTTGSDNTASGAYSLNSNTTGTLNTASGSSSLQQNTTGSSNTATGFQSLYFNTTGTQNTASGALSLKQNTSGYNNTSFGAYSLFSNTIGTDNTASGSGSLYSNTTGVGNTASGLGSLNSNTIGNYNTSIGINSGFDHTTANYNTYLGYLTTGGNNSNVTVLGSNATATMSNCIILGANVNAGIGTSAPSLARLQVQGAVGNTVAYFSQSANSRGLSLISDNPALCFNSYWNGGFKSMAATGYPAIVNSDQNSGGIYFQTSDVANTAANASVGCPERMRITGAGRVGIGTTVPGGLFELSLDQGRKPSTSTWTILSDVRLKNIDGSYTKGLKEILQLRPLLYHYKNTGDHTFSAEVLNTQSVGFVAQDVQKIFPECVSTDDDGYLNLNVHAILVAYTNAIKEQQEEIETLRKENTSMKQTLTEILEKLNTGETEKK